MKHFCQRRMKKKQKWFKWRLSYLISLYLVTMESTEISIPRMRLIPSTRFTLALLVSFALFIQYSQRVSLSMGIVCMVNRTTTDNASKFSLKYGSELLNDKKFAWTEFQQQILLGAYWFGYIFTLIPSNLSENRHCIHSIHIYFEQAVGYQLL